VYRASPSPLIEAKYFDTAGSKGGKEFIISIAVVTKAMDENNLSDRLSVRLQLWLAELTKEI
jgi:hypothetical protein